MKVCLDVQYHPNHAIAAAVLFNDWADAVPTREVTVRVENIAPYQSGAFYKRELPCLLAALENISEPLEVVVIDGFVWLDATQKPGLGAHLYAVLEQKISVIGVAKTAFQGAPALEVWRGESKQALLVSSLGCDLNQAANLVQGMHGAYRLPTLLKRVDQVARGKI